jgi:hypothetical protein
MTCPSIGWTCAGGNIPRLAASGRTVVYQTCKVLACTPPVQNLNQFFSTVIDASLLVPAKNPLT